MPSLKDIKTRINSVKNTQKITKAMKMVAAAKLNRAQSSVQAARPYAHKMHQVISNLVARAEEGSHPLLEQRDPVDKVLVYAIASDRGLCGGFNSYLFRGVENFIRDEELSGEEVAVVTAGRKSRDYFRRSKHEVEKNFMDVVDGPGYDEAKRLAKHATKQFLTGEYDAVYVAYNEFVSAIEYNTLVEPVLPLSKEIFGAGEADGEEAEEGMGASEYIYEPDEEGLLAQTLPGYVEVKFLQALLESYAAEQGARMTAMDNATSNAEDMIDSLTTQYNRARQAYITKEICEIVSGAESLKG
ncbi:ATP synthase F1 subunit gamma [Persicimonas caeni]|uniref:ATP synthase gamma chain n=1 Tax=Persicimonas caeni TaxID=2292766 RepID=A0A4Y6PRB3_PERCE|nr:ATP synthase F1 subunit gamma [Persicimonas caeni]QDG50780.1 ATP synthase F1 subunit gamma [Persicimonas caeni]QED32001.1 ATP synthase F1 subunit gamma [Persicimonas caeni]